MLLKITNTATGKKEEFKTLQPNQVTMYVCGITPYDRSHLGHGRCYVTFDVLYRLLRFLGYTVTYCRNFTDIDDKLLNKAQQQLGDKLRYKELADTYIKSYHEDMKALNCLSPNYEPCVTEHIPQIIAFIERLIKSGHAYQVNGNVYFNIASFPAYAQLSKHDVHDLRAGARVQVEEEKKDPLDFALWKSESEGEFWKSPWGYGRPGWHIECSALAAHYLGEQIDIHGGGLDLVFPHHENEIAQSQALHQKPLANYWMHNGLVQINKEKMSKSSGNILGLHELFKQIDPMVLRFYFLTHHYRSPLDFSFENLLAVQKSYQRLVRTFECDACTTEYQGDMQKVPLIGRMLEFLLDDMNTVGMFGVLFENLSELAKNNEQLCTVKHFIQEVLGLTLKPLPEEKVEITPEIEQLLNEREKARAQKNWTRADEIRDKLRDLGFDVQDKKMK